MFLIIWNVSNFKEFGYPKWQYRSWIESKYRFDIVRATKGTHMEHYIGSKTMFLLILLYCYN